MSSTNRGSNRSEFDYYVTRPDDVVDFLQNWVRRDPRAAKLLGTRGTRIFDPCAGGNTEPVDWVMKEATPEVGVKGQKGYKAAKPAKIVHIPITPMSYPLAIGQVFGDAIVVDTMDIRENSFSEFIGDFLKMRPPNPPDIVMGNPPFDLALEFIKRGLKFVPEHGYVVMLLRLNYYGTQLRKAFFDVTMPEYTFVHHQRLSFLPDGTTDSIEYAHYVWSPLWKEEYSKLYVI